MPFFRMVCALSQKSLYDAVSPKWKKLRVRELRDKSSGDPITTPISCPHNSELCKFSVLVPSGPLARHILCVLIVCGDGMCVRLCMFVW